MSVLQAVQSTFFDLHVCWDLWNFRGFPKTPKLQKIQDLLEKSSCREPERRELKQLKASFIKEFSLQVKQTKCRHVNSTAQGLQDEDNSCGIASSLPAGYPIFFAVDRDPTEFFSRQLRP